MAPTTSYILDGLRDSYIKNADPSKMGQTPLDGLKKKEERIKRFTHEELAKNIKNYETKEARIAATLGSNFSKLLCGKYNLEDRKKTPPTVEFSSFYPVTTSSSSSSSSPLDNSIYANTNYYLETIISGGNMGFDSFSYQWFLTKFPPSGDVIITEVSSEKYPTYWHILTEVNFTLAGFYVLQMQLNHSVYTGLFIKHQINATVI